jgi:hypothetical protein
MSVSLRGFANERMFGVRAREPAGIPVARGTPAPVLEALALLPEAAYSDRHPGTVRPGDGRP